MRVKALKTFQNQKYGLIRTGTIFHCEPHIAQALLANKLIEPAAEAQVPPAQNPDPTDPSPEHNRNVPNAPQRSGNENPGSTEGNEQAGNQGEAPAGTGRRRGGGKPMTSRSLRADLAQRAQTQSSAESGETQTPASGT